MPRAKFVAKRPLIRTSHIRHPITVTARGPQYQPRPDEGVLPGLLVRRYCDGIAKIGDSLVFTHADRGYDAIERILPAIEDVIRAEARRRALEVARFLQDAEQEITRQYGVPKSKRFREKVLELALS